MEPIRQSLAVIAVLLLLGGLAWLSRRAGLRGSRGAQRGCVKTMLHLERLALTPQHSLHLLRVGEQSLVVGVHATGVSFICEVKKANSTGS
jgi:flagellar biogenesis protein FliO